MDPREHFNICEYVCSFVVSIEKIHSNVTKTFYQIYMCLLPNAGGSFLRSLMRVGGVFLGAAYALASWSVAPANPYTLAIMNGMGYFVFLHMRFHFRYGWIGTVGLFMQTLNSLYKYQNRDTVGFPSMVELTYIIIVNVCLGVATVLVITLVIWPYIDAIEVQSLLSRLSLDLSAHYQDIMTFLHMTEEVFEKEKQNVVSHARKMEAKSQEVIIKCREMISFAQAQPQAFTETAL